MKKGKEHLTNIGETYMEHFFHAFRYSLCLFTAALVCLVHAFFPGLFTCTTGKIIEDLHDNIKERKEGD